MAVGAGGGGNRAPGTADCRSSWARRRGPIATSHQLLSLRTTYAGCEVASAGAKWGLGWLTCGRRSGWRRQPKMYAALTGCWVVSRRRATDDHQLRVCGVRFAHTGSRTVADRARTAYVSCRRATNDRRPGVCDAHLAPPGHR